MKFGNTNTVISTVGRNGKGFRSVRKRSDGDSGSTEKDLARSFVDITSSICKTAVNPSAPVIGLSVSDINWPLVRTDDRIFLLLASAGLSEWFEPAEMERKDLLHHALSVFRLKSIKYILSELRKCYPDVPVGETDTLEQFELVPIVVNFLMFVSIAKSERSTKPVYTVKCDQYLDANGNLVIDDTDLWVSSDEAVEEEDDEPDLSEKETVARKSKPSPSSEKASPDSIILENEWLDYTHPDLSDGWKRKSMKRKGGKTRGSIYHHYLSPDNKLIKSLKLAKAHSSKSNITEAAPPSSKSNGNSNAGVDSDDLHPQVAAADGVQRVSQLVVREYQEVFPVTDNFDNMAMSKLTEKMQLTQIHTAGANHVQAPTGKTLDPRNTFKILHALADVVGDVALNTEKKLVSFVADFMDLASDEDFYPGIKNVMEEFMDECEYSYNKVHRSIDWYFTLFEVLSSIICIEICLLLPPDGTYGESSETRIVSFAPGGLKCPRKVYFRLLIDRTITDCRLGDGGDNVAGVTFYIEGNDSTNSDYGEDGHDDDDHIDDDVGTAEHSNSNDSSVRSNVARVVLRHNKLVANPYKKVSGSRTVEQQVGSIQMNNATSEEIEEASDFITARSLFTTPVKKKVVGKPTSLSEGGTKPSKRSSDDRLAQENAALLKRIKLLEMEKNNIVSTPATSSSTVTAEDVKGEFKSGDLTGMELLDSVSTVSGSGSGGGGCGAWANVDVSSVTTGTLSPLKSSLSPITVEVSCPITHNKSSKQVYLITFTEMGRRAWYLKGEHIRSILLTYWKHTSRAADTMPGWYECFTETFIKESNYSTDNILKRRSTGSNYPVTKLTTVLMVPTGSFPIETHLRKMENTMKLLMSDAEKPAYIALTVMEQNSNNLYNRFLEGKYRNRPNKNVSYKDRNELLQDIISDFQHTWKSGFDSVSYGVPLNKYLTDFGIKTHLQSIGYTSFDDVPENEKRNVFKDGNFPDWNEIIEDSIME